jgi:hypothetical protein
MSRAEKTGARLLLGRDTMKRSSVQKKDRWRHVTRDSLAEGELLGPFYKLQAQQPVKGRETRPVDQTPTNTLKVWRQVSLS